MKKNSIFRYYGLLSATMVFSLFSLKSSAQELTASIQSPVDIHTGASISTKTPVSVNVKIMESFKRSFEGVQDPVWEVVNKRYYAHFQLGDRQAMAAFWENGKIDYSILYGTEKHLPSYVKLVLNANFSDYVIRATQYVVKYNVGTWVVTFETKRDIYKVKVNGDDVHILEQMKKAK